MEFNPPNPTVYHSQLEDVEGGQQTLLSRAKSNQTFAESVLHSEVLFLKSIKKAGFVLNHIKHSSGLFAAIIASKVQL